MTNQPATTEISNLEVRGPTQNDSEDIFDILNDDCIRHIFRKLEDLEDLANAGKTSKRFWECATSLNFRFRSVAVEDTRHCYSDRNVITADDAPQFFHNFGHLVQSVDWLLVENQERADELFSILEQHCGATLKTLKIEHCSPKFNRNNQFTALERLIVHHAEPLELGLDSPIKYLEILTFGQIEEDQWFHREFPHLESVRFNSTEITDDTLSEFLQLNQQLSSVEIMNSEYITPLILEDIGYYLTDLERLEISSREFQECETNELHKQLLHLTTLQKLSELRISGRVSLDILLKMFAENNVPLRSLEVELAPTKDTVTSFHTIQTLKKVECTCLSDVHVNTLINLVKSQTALQTLQILNMGAKITIGAIEKILECGRNLTYFELTFCGSDFSMGSYNRILSLARNRVKVEIVVSQGTQVDVPLDILRMNRDWLSIMFDC